MLDHFYNFIKTEMLRNTEINYSMFYTCSKLKCVIL